MTERKPRATKEEFLKAKMETDAMLYRRLKDLTQAELDEAVNLSRTHIRNLEAPGMPTSISIRETVRYC